MLLGGVLKDEGSTAGVEVLNLKTMKQCSTSAPLPESAFGAAFFILGGQVHLVGGYRSQIDKRDLHLFDLKSRTWQTSDLFPTNLADAVVAQISHFWVLITGGSDTPNTTIVHVNGSVLPGPPLPFQIMRHCALGVDEEHVFIAGGSRDGLGPTKEAFILNWADQTKTTS
ncbi:uncharacterized protein LOC131891681 [Tigriopus californicus]|uniref:uncharacterized protein LOC131891681 n=1 Tax=Tigriopus californicus TaxID=6832 RepID=UPI0027DAA219|nr:uncharacterized protein LOC131891681 [Tigriopus californicus]